MKDLIDDMPVGWKPGDRCEVLAKPMVDGYRHEPAMWRSATVTQLTPSGMIVLEFWNGVGWTVDAKDVAREMRRPEVPR